MLVLCVNILAAFESTHLTVKAPKFGLSFGAARWELGGMLMLEAPLGEKFPGEGGGRLYSRYC